VHVSLLDEKTRSEGTDEAWAGRTSIAMRKSSGNMNSFCWKLENDTVSSVYDMAGDDKEKMVYDVYIYT